MDLYSHTPLLAEYQSYEDAREEFDWSSRDEYNVATDLLGTQPNADKRVALVVDGPEGETRYTYADVDAASNRVANLFADRGVERGDRVGVAAPNGFLTFAVHMAVFKLGAILVPLSSESDAEALDYRLTDSDVEFLVANATVLDRIATTMDLDADFTAVFSLDGGTDADVHLEREFETFDDTFETCETTIDDPAMLIYTSGTTSDPKGVIHSQGHFVGCYPGAEMWNNLDVGPSNVHWSNTEWAYVGTLCYLYTALHYGGTFVVSDVADRDDVRKMVEVLDEYDVTNAFIKPGHLETMRSELDTLPELDLSVVSTGGSPYGEALFEWVETELGAAPVEAYGQTEAQLFISDCPAWFESRADRIGKPAPGADVQIVDQFGKDVGAGSIGELSVNRSHPVAFDGYWELPERTDSQYIDGVTLTDVMCRRDDDGYVEFVSRKDDIIPTDGRYVKPSDVEAAIDSHPGVSKCGVVANEGESGTEIVAFVEETDWTADKTDREVESELLAVADDELAAHQVPSSVVVRDDMPTTKRGKIRRTELREAVRELA